MKNNKAKTKNQRHRLRNTSYLKPLEKDIAQSNNSLYFAFLWSHLYFRVKLAKSIENHRFYAIKILKRHQVEQINLSAFKKILSNEVSLI